MSATGDAVGSESNREEFPALELECLLDDWDSPGEVTIFAEDQEDEWITIDAEYAIDLDIVP